MQSQRILCGLTGIFAGGLGIHRFLLGDALGGLIRLLLTVASCGAASVIGPVEGILYLMKSDEQFIQEYQVGKKAWA
jgi:TM2 domain-containing membrane protein YozV